ncbi:MAG: dihydroorotase [Actinomycetota bacterium]|nr:dihydroorotase [Actinomycetota bacterium]
MSELLLRGGLVLTPRGPVEADVLIRDGRVAAVGTGIEVEGTEAYDCAGSWVGPGLVDPHTHLREPGQEWKEDIDSGSAAAAAGGFTALVAMPNTDPPIDSGHIARYVVDRGARVGIVEVATAGTISEGRAGERLAHLDDLWDAGVRMFTDDGDAVADGGLMRRALEYVGERGGVIVQHAVDPGLSREGQMHEGAVSSLLGMIGIPAQAEDVLIARDLALVEMTGARYHVQHLSTVGGVALVADAKERGLPVTAEVTPHHLSFDDGAVANTDPVYKMMPPLRSAADVVELRDGLRSGIIDMVGTDHAPHAAHEKDVPFEHAPNGVIGLEWAAAVVNETVGLEVGPFFDRMSVAPARLAGFADQGNLVEAGMVANLMVFDPEETWLAERAVSKSSNAPYLGTELAGRVRLTVYRGAVTARDGMPVVGVM